MKDSFLLSIRGIAGLPLLALLMLCGCANSADSPVVLLERARILMDRNQAEEAIPLFNAAIEGLPGDAQALYLRGVAYERLNLPERALADYSACLQLVPERRDAMNNKAVMLARLNRFDEAAAEFSRLLEINPQDAMAFRNRGLCRADQGLHEQALADYDRAVQLAPQEPAGWFQRGNVYLNQDEFRRAEADYSKAIELDPDFARAWMNRGIARYQVGRRADAAEDFEMAQSLDDRIVVPGLDFYSDSADRQRSADDLTVSRWESIREAALGALRERGLTDPSIVQEFPQLWCAEVTADSDGVSRTILITCRIPGRSDLLLPVLRQQPESNTAPELPSLLVLQFEPSEMDVPIEQTFIERWNPQDAEAEPAIMKVSKFDN